MVAIVWRPVRLRLCVFAGGRVGRLLHRRARQRHRVVGAHGAHSHVVCTGCHSPACCLLLPSSTRCGSLTNTARAGGGDGRAHRIRATHAHLVELPSDLRSRVLSVQVNAGSTGDQSFFHGRLYPDQQQLTPTSNPPCHTCSQLGKGSDAFHKYYMQIAETYASTYAVVHPTPAPTPTPTPPTPTTCDKGATCHDCFFGTFHCQDRQHPVNASACLACVDTHRAALSAAGADGKPLCDLNASHVQGWCRRTGPAPPPARVAKPVIQLLFNGFSGNADLVALVDTSSMRRDGFMIKDGLVSHSYSVSGEMEVWNTSRVLLQTELPGDEGKYVRSRGESTLSAFVDWELQPAWTAWALATWAACYGLDTWQNNTLMEDVAAMRPALSFFTKYAGNRDGQGGASPGAWAALRDGLDVADTARFPETVFGKVVKSASLARCSTIVAAVGRTQSAYPPRLDSPSNASCGSGRHRLGLNDAGYQVCRSQELCQKPFLRLQPQCAEPRHASTWRGRL